MEVPIKVTYRKLKPENSAEYRALRLEGLRDFPHAFGASYDQEVQLVKLRFQVFIEEQVSGKFMIGAFVENVLIGICGFIQEEQPNSRHRGIVIQMYVKKQFKGNKIGLKLINALKREAFFIPELEMLTLGVMSGNKSANKVYEAAGFMEYGFLSGFYHSEEGILDQRFMVFVR